MYYNNNKHSNYYNAYKQEMANLDITNSHLSFLKIIKSSLILLAIGLAILAGMYLVQYLSSDIKTMTSYKPLQIREEPINILALENKLPKSIQFIKEEKSISQTNIEDFNRKKITISHKDIKLIVELIANQMNYIPEPTLEKKFQPQIKKHTLKESNHYNKITLSSTMNPNDNSDKQLKLRQKLNSIIKSMEGQLLISLYEHNLKKELKYRSNEMRIIVVQEGDTLSKIAKKAYGNYDDYIRILSANPEVLKNPNQIFVGQKLRIPS